MVKRFVSRGSASSRRKRSPELKFQWGRWPAPGESATYRHKSKKDCFVQVEMYVGRMFWKVYARGDCCLGKGLCSDKDPDREIPHIERAFLIAMLDRRWT